MSYVCKHGYKCMCFQCGEKDCEYFESEQPKWVKDIFENEEIKEKLKRISEPMSDLISRRAAIANINKAIPEWSEDKEVAIDCLKNTSTAQPEIIRCKDCAKREHCRTSTVWAVAPPDDWYCADAERRTDEQIW